MLFVCLEIARGKMVVVLCIAPCLSVDGNSCKKTQATQPPELGAERVVAPALPRPHLLTLTAGAAIAPLS